MSIPIKISGSRAAAILGLSPYQTAVSVWLSIMEEIKPGFCAENNYELPVFEGNAATRFGHAFENEVIRFTGMKYGAAITDREKLFTRDYLSCHIDALMGDVLIEAKTTTEFSFKMEWGEPGTDKIPIGYQLQVAHNLLLTGKEKCIMPVLIFPRRQSEMEEIGIGVDDNFDMINIAEWVRVLSQMGYLQFFEIHANPELQSIMLQKYRTFWENHVLTGTPPVPMCVDDIKALVREPIGTIIADERVERLVMERDNIMSEIGKGGSLSKRAEELRLEILKYMTAAGAVPDDESRNKFILRGRDGKKLASYGADKNGRMVMR